MKILARIAIVLLAVLGVVHSNGSQEKNVEPQRAIEGSKVKVDPWQLIEEDVRAGDFARAIAGVRNGGKDGIALARTSGNQHFLYGMALFRQTAPQILQTIEGNPSDKNTLKKLQDDLRVARGELGQAQKREKELVEEGKGQLIKLAKSMDQMAASLEAELFLLQQANVGKKAEETDAEAVWRAVEMAVRSDPLLKANILEKLKEKKKAVKDADDRITKSETGIAQFYTTIKDMVRAVAFVQAQVETLTTKKNVVKNEVEKLDDKVAGLGPRFQKEREIKTLPERSYPPKTADNEPYPAWEMLQYLRTTAKRVEQSKNAANDLAKQSLQAGQKKGTGENLLKFWSRESTVTELFLRARLQELEQMVTPLKSEKVNPKNDSK